ncbi:PAS domain S-box protein, partial [Natronoarchaeum sp. GCM10025703]|uniref:PAS domain S-box protein n=1 Tax=Natronoarchaeum sp. GCM10025703 TaxID=3252685 RepID=UPI0036141CEF
KKDSIDVLHVDDNNQMRTLFRIASNRSTGRLVTSVGDPVAVLDRLDTDIECIVSDYEMPTMNGLELLRAVSADRPDLPFILLTGKGSEEVASEAISAGADYFRKSDIAQQFPVLAQRIENVVEGERAEMSYRELFGLAAEGFAFHPETGAFIDANPAFLEIFGVERAELLSMGLNDLWSIPRQDHQETTLSDHFQRAATDGMTSTEECCQRASGERFWVEFKFKPIEVKGRSLVLTQARDITDRRRYEQTLSALHTAVTDIVAADQSRQVTGSVLSTVDNLLAADRGAVFRHVSSKNWLEVVDAMSLPSVAARSHSIRITRLPVPSSTAVRSR